MLLNNKLCVDAGTVNCPCRLAECGKCIVCSRLGESGNCAGCRKGDCSCSSDGPAVCDCQWQGVCIYNEYLQNNLCINDWYGACNKSASGHGTCSEQRQIRNCEIQKIKWFKDDLAVMRIGVPKGMAEKAELPGSFVFVKSPGAEDWFDFPLSVMRADYEKSVIELAVNITGPKSHALMEPYRGSSTDELSIDDAWRGEMKSAHLGYVELRGIYRNGMLGTGKLMEEKSTSPGNTALNGINGARNTAETGNRRVLCLTKGVGIAPVANYIRWAGTRDRIDVIADLDKINRSFAEYALENCRINSLVYGHLPLNMPWAESEKYDTIVISASEYYQKNIYVPETKKVLSNNTSMCCGEGICGACMCTDENGVSHRRCKECRVR